MESHYWGDPDGSRGRAIKTGRPYRTGNPGGNMGEHTSHAVPSDQSAMGRHSAVCSVCDASRVSWLVHAGSTLGIVPTTVRSTLDILHNMCARHFKYWEG